MSRPITGMSSTTGGASQPDWSALPSELLRFISEGVAEIGDYVRFGAVCKLWHSAASPAANLLPKAPWLLLPYDTNSTVRRFFSFSSRRRYMLDLPNFRGRVICNSAAGWMLMVDSSFSFSLFNPLTKDQIHLPPLSTALNVLYDNLLVTRDRTAIETYGRLDPNTQLLAMHHCFHSHLSMTANGEGIITVILGDRYVYCRAQGTSWVNPRGIYWRSLETVAYHRGKFYIVHRDGQVAECELNPESERRLIPSLSVPTVNFGCCYLVEVNGELLLVICNDRNDDLEYFKLDAVGQPKWSKINGIGHYSLLVGDGVITATAARTSGCTGNSIYQCILDENFRELLLVMRSIANDARKILFVEDVDKYYSHGTWFTPTPHGTWFFPTLCFRTNTSAAAPGHF